MECCEQPTAAHNCPLLDDRGRVLGERQKESKVTRKTKIYDSCQFQKWEDYKAARGLKTRGWGRREEDRCRTPFIYISALRLYLSSSPTVIYYTGRTLVTRELQAQPILTFKCYSKACEKCFLCVLSELTFRSACGSIITEQRPPHYSVILSVVKNRGLHFFVCVKGGKLNKNLSDLNV